MTGPGRSGCGAGGCTTAWGPPRPACLALMRRWRPSCSVPRPPPARTHWKVGRPLFACDGVHCATPVLIISCRLRCHQRRRPVRDALVRLRLRLRRIVGRKPVHGVRVYAHLSPSCGTASAPVAPGGVPCLRRNAPPPRLRRLQSSQSSVCRPSPLVALAGSWLVDDASDSMEEWLREVGWGFVARGQASPCGRRGNSVLDLFIVRISMVLVYPCVGVSFFLKLLGCFVKQVWPSEGWRGI